MERSVPPDRARSPRRRERLRDHRVGLRGAAVTTADATSAGTGPARPISTVKNWLQGA